MRMRSPYPCGVTLPRSRSRPGAQYDLPPLPSLFQAMVPEANQVAAAAEHVKVSTLRQKYGYAGMFPLLEQLTEEFADRCEAML